ncbi:YqkE family protein [Chryseomicrobium palamuruense]|uniref:YqkE family protein n=1 Tax=Chryseomicrobium palamuruense TaxID=682973 RepID=A0ABV8UTQ9_9BACL
MAKKKKDNRTRADVTREKETKDDRLTLKEQLSDSIFEKLQAKKRELKEEEIQKEQEEEARRAFEKKQREKNMSFEELLSQHGDKGSKY